MLRPAEVHFSVAPGTYRVRFAASGYVTRYNGGAINLAGAPDVVVAAEGSVAADATLVLGGTVDGVVSLEGGGAASEMTVVLFDVDKKVLRKTVTDGTGAYSFDKLPAGTYRVKFRAVSPYSWVWNGGGKNFAQAPGIAVTGGSTASVDQQVPLA